MFLFVWIVISFLVVCTILLFVVFVREVLFLLFRSVFVCSICKFVREFSLDSRGVEPPPGTPLYTGAAALMDHFDVLGQRRREHEMSWRLVQLGTPFNKNMDLSSAVHCPFTLETFLNITTFRSQLLASCFTQSVGLRFLVMGLFEKQSVWDTFCSIAQTETKIF
jgi:hypothetical protein